MLYQRQFAAVYNNNYFLIYQILTNVGQIPTTAALRQPVQIQLVHLLVRVTMDTREVEMCVWVRSFFIQDQPGFQIFRENNLNLK